MIMHRLVATCFLATFATGCAAQVPQARNMAQVTPPRPFSAPADRALVVFVRPSRYAWGISANIIDEQGHFLGDSPASGNFAALLPPGHHMFVVWAENTDAIDADLAPGKIYFVEVAPTMGWLSAQMHLFAIKQANPNFVHRDEWMRATNQWAVDGTGGQANLDQRSADVQERLRRAQEHLQRYSGGDRELHTLRAADGI